ncbi:hypothetical protein [Nonomuraea sp. NPDC049480]|uniref:hypothetical protein n=1 Tax=Nonomuraea sp. NPDC049480 TaxID=3364353 RepID=UPI0037B3EBD4
MGAPPFSWGPPADRDRVPSLLGETGELFTHDRIPDLPGRARLDEIEVEVEVEFRA